jgi:hypothetical protein
MRFSIYQQDPGDFGGWVHLNSTVPIAPWGVAPDYSEIEDSQEGPRWGTMTFYREEELQILPIDPIP